MYSQEAIEALYTRVGWRDSQDPSFTLEVTTDNLQSDSGLTLDSFHKLVTVENVNAAIVDANVNAEDFNEILSEIRKQAVLTVVPLILDYNAQYVEDTDYSGDIETYVMLFDQAIGYQAALMALELFMSSSRSNLLERNSKLAINNLKLEVEGFVSETTGRLMAKGISQKLNMAVRKAANKIFPIKAIVTSEKIW